MPEPWDTPALPTTADANIDRVYAGVGRVMSQWEALEVQLFRIHSFFCFRPDDVELMLKYGEERIFANRLMQLEDVAIAFFNRHHNQDVEGEFGNLITCLKGFSGRRNDVAHGIVMPVQVYGFFAKTADQLLPRTNYWALVPPVYKWKGHSLDAVPPYAYNSQGLKELADRLSELYARTSKFREHLRRLVRTSR